MKRVLVEASARAGATLGRVVLVVALMLFPDSAAAGNDGRLGAVGPAEPCRGGVVRDERAQPGSQDAVDVLVYGGWRQLWGGDVNEAVADATGHWAGWVLRDGFMPLADGDAPAARRGGEYGVRFAVPLSGGFRFVAGIGRIDGDSVGRVVETPVTPQPHLVVATSRAGSCGTANCQWQPKTAHFGQLKTAHFGRRVPTRSVRKYTVNGRA